MTTEKCSNCKVGVKVNRQDGEVATPVFCTRCRDIALRIRSLQTDLRIAQATWSRRRNMHLPAI